jgi:hypothetical protein
MNLISKGKSGRERKGRGGKREKRAVESSRERGKIH